MVTTVFYASWDFAGEKDLTCAIFDTACSKSTCQRVLKILCPGNECFYLYHDMQSLC